jgi:hypothetical protein
MLPVGIGGCFYQLFQAMQTCFYPQDNTGYLEIPEDNTVFQNEMDLPQLMNLIQERFGEENSLLYAALMQLGNRLKPNEWGIASTILNEIWNAGEAVYRRQIDSTAANAIIAQSVGRLKSMRGGWNSAICDICISLKQALNAENIIPMERAENSILNNNTLAVNNPSAPLSLSISPIFIFVIEDIA